MYRDTLRASILCHTHIWPEPHTNRTQEKAFGKRANRKKTRRKEESDKKKSMTVADANFKRIVRKM